MLLNIKSYYLYIHCIYILIYVKVFEYAFILKYRGLFKYLFFYFFIKVFKVIKVFKKRSAEYYSALPASGFLHCPATANIYFNLSPKLREMILVCFQIIIQDKFCKIKIMDDRIKQKTLQCLFIIAFHSGIHAQLRDH